MGANAIEIYRKNSKTIVCTVTGLTSLSGYTATLSAKINHNDTDAIISKVGTISGLVITFLLTPSHTNVTAKIYHYDIIIDNEANEYTVVQDILEIKKSVYEPTTVAAIAMEEEIQYFYFTDGTNTVRRGVRDGYDVYDVALTSTGFSGTEGPGDGTGDWERRERNKI